MRCDADVPDNAARLCLQQGLHRAAGRKDGLEPLHTGVVELEHLDVVGAQVFQAGGKLGLHVGLCQGAAFCGKDKVIPQAGLLEGLADPRLADCVGARGVDVVDAGLVGGNQQLPRAGLVDALDRDAAEPQTGNFQACLTKVDILHSVLLLLCCGASGTPPLQIVRYPHYSKSTAKIQTQSLPRRGKAAPQGRMRGAFGHYCPVKGSLRQALPSSDCFAASFSPKGEAFFPLTKRPRCTTIKLYKNKV